MSIVIINEHDIYLTAKQADGLAVFYRKSQESNLNISFESWYRRLEKSRTSKIWLKRMLKELGE